MCAGIAGVRELARWMEHRVWRIGIANSQGLVLAPSFWSAVLSEGRLL